MSEEGDRLQMRRERLGLSKVDLEKLSTVHRATIADIEKGKGFRMGTLRKLERALDAAEAGTATEPDAPDDVVTITVTIHGLGRAIRAALSERDQ